MEPWNYSLHLVQQIIKQLLEIIYFLKEQKVIFRDLTPFSIYIRAENKQVHVTLADFFL